jgi:hypothetical protein
MHKSPPCVAPISISSAMTFVPVVAILTALLLVVFLTVGKN